MLIKEVIQFIVATSLIRTFQFHVESTVWDYWKGDLLTMFCYFAPVIRHSVRTMCTMFLERTSLGCLVVCSEFPPEKPTLNLDV